MTDQRKDEGKGGTSEHRRIKVLIRDEDLDTVKAHHVKFGLSPEGIEDVEGQVYILTIPRPGDHTDDVEGHGSRFSGPGQTAEDVEGDGIKFGLEPATGEDVEGHGGRWGYLRETDDDTEGQSRRVWIFEPATTTKAGLAGGRKTGASRAAPPAVRGGGRRKTWTKS
jgi:hypothetical protein